MVKPDGPSPVRIAYLVDSPEEEDKGLLLSGYAGAKLWGMAGAEGLPYRRAKGGKPYGPCVSDNGESAWVGSILDSPPKEELKGTAIDRVLGWRLPKLYSLLPKAEVYIAMGEMACRALVSGGLPTSRRANYKSLLKHASCVVPSAEACGFLQLPPNSFVIPLRPTSALLKGSDEWFPSVKQSLNRAARLLGLASQGPLPSPPPQQFYLEETDISIPLEAALKAGAYSIDIETPIQAHIPDALYIGSVCVGEKAWVFGAADFVRLCSRLFGSTALCIGQNIATFDLPVLAKQGLPLPKGGIFDTRWVDAILRPRMPHDLAHMAAHLLPWGPPNWKWEAEDVFASSLPGRKYCAKDSWFTWQIAAFQQKELEERGLLKASKVRMDMLPKISTVAVQGVRVDRGVRRELRTQLVIAVDDLTSEVQGYLEEWARGERVLLFRDLDSAYKKYSKYKDASYKQKGVGLRRDWLGIKEGSLFEDATILELREKAKKILKEEVKPLQKRVDQLKNVRPSQTGILGEFLFTHPRGLRLEPAGKTKTGLPKVGREDLEKVSRRADVAKLLEAGDERPKILLRISDANRVGGELGTHLGVLMDKKTKRYDLGKDAQLRADGRLSIIFNPVRKRFSAGKGKSDKPITSSYQSHNIPSSITVVVKGIRKTWNLRNQIIPDLDTQELATADWEKMEQYVMAWQAGDRIGYWDWLKDLYNKIDTHALMAADVLPGCPSSTEGAKSFSITIGGREWTGYNVGKQVNHAMTLGASWYMLHTKLDIPVKDAKAIVERFDSSERGQAIRELHAHIKAEVIRDKRVMTPFGEPVDFWNLTYDGVAVTVKDAKGPYSVAQQDTAAIMMMHCLSEIDNAAQEGGGRFLIQAHDEFVYSFLKGKGDQVNGKVRRIMEREWGEMVVPFSGGRGLSIPVDINVGKSWGSAKDY